MAPYITNPRLHLDLSRLHAHLVNVYGELTGIIFHKLYAAVLKILDACELPAPIAFYHPDRLSPRTDQASLSSNLEAPQHRVYRMPFNLLSIWAYLAIAFVILVMVTVISYMLYSCYHTAGLTVKLKTGTGMGVGAGTGGVKGGWQNLEDPSEESEDTRSTKDQDIVDVNCRDEYKTDGLFYPWNERSGPGLKGLGIQLERSSQHEFTSHPNESQTSMIHGSPHSTYSIGSTSDHEHEQDLESSDGPDSPSISAKPLAHTVERSATQLPFNVPLPLPIPLPSPVTPSPLTQKQVKQKRTRLRALTQILAHNLLQNQNGREIYFELQPMILPAEKGVDGQSKGLLSETPDDLSPLSSPLSSSQFAFFAPYPNCNSTSSNSTSNSTSNATFTSNSSGKNSSDSPIATSTPITPLTPITPITPVTPTKPGPSGAAAAELRFDCNNIQFIETPSSDAASSPEVQGAPALTRAEMLWKDPKLSPVQGVPLGLDGEKPSVGSEVSRIAIAKTGAGVPGHVFGLATPDKVHRNLRLGHLRRGVSLSSPPSPSPSSRHSDSSVFSSPSITTARFILDRAELRRDNLRNRDRVKEKEDIKDLSPIPRPVFPRHPQPSRSEVV